MATMTYAQWQTAIQNLMATTSGDTDLSGIQPQAIDYAEQRIQRELDLLTNVTAGTVTISARTASVPSSILIVQEVNIINGGVRSGLRRRSLAALNYVWGDTSATGQPVDFAMLTDTTMIFGPVPDAGYSGEVIGPIRLTALSATNTTTWIATNLPDLFLAGTMVFLSGWARDFGATSDDPKMAQSWENQYQLLLASAKVEEQRRKGASTGWQAYEPAPLANPPRG